MLSKSEDYLDVFAKAGASALTVHWEAENAGGCLRHIRSLGLPAGLSVGSCMYFAEQLIGTVITVEDGFVTIKHLFGKTRIAFSEICSVQIERYRRIRKRKRTIFPNGGYQFQEQRLRMTISVMHGNNIVLTDTAMTATGGLPGGLFSTMEPLPDEAVPLYNAYQSIRCHAANSS